MRALIVMVLLLGVPVAVLADKNIGTNVKQSSGDNLNIGIPQAPGVPTTLGEVAAICAIKSDSHFCQVGKELVEPPLLCRRVRGVFGLRDLPFLGRYC